jgi:hypothetical protein
VLQPGPLLPHFTLRTALVGKEGVEPSWVTPADFKSAAYAIPPLAPGTLPRRSQSTKMACECQTANCYPSRSLSGPKLRVGKRRASAQETCSKHRIAASC